MAEKLTEGVVFFLSYRQLMLVPTVIQGIEPTCKGVRMDEYQEELLEYQAFELDPLEPADDATEL